MDSRIPALVVRQWLSPEWDQVKSTDKHPELPYRRPPKRDFYIFSISAYDLKRLSGIYRRDPSLPPAQDQGIQRRHMPERSQEILRYVKDGFPLSRIGAKKLVNQDEIDDLRMPGWIPTSIVANILTADDRRGPKGVAVDIRDLVRIESSGASGVAEIILPSNFGDAWAPIVYPIEIIDGQHRLWAFEDGIEDKFSERLKDIQIPVVAFHGLDISWQAYLFYTINQLPKKIDSSMVFDLYPLLRTEDWLLRFEGPNIYRESRAQDLTTILWSHTESPWYHRILRLGGREKGKVTQAAFIRSLLTSFIKSWDPRGKGKIGGLFGSSAQAHSVFLGWGREQQAAFLILVWQILADCLAESSAEWAQSLLGRSSDHNLTLSGAEGKETRKNILFAGADTLIATDQGVRGYLLVINDLLWTAQMRGQIDLQSWIWERDAEQSDEEAVSSALQSLRFSLPDLVALTTKVGVMLSQFDWRVSSAVKGDPGFQQQAAYRGSGGYKLLRENLLKHIINGDEQLRTLTEAVMGNMHEEVDEE